MAGNYAQLLDIINNPTNHSLPAWDNDNKLIEGLTIKQYLLTIIQSLTAGYQFMGVATPSTLPGTPDQNVFYIGGAGTYANFGTSITVRQGQICVFKWNGSWTNTPIEIANSGFVNVNDINGRASEYESASAARSAVPTAYRKIGLNITYLLSTGWHIEQFVGSNISDWETASNWETRSDYEEIMDDKIAEYNETITKPTSGIGRLIQEITVFGTGYWNRNGNFISSGSYNSGDILVNEGQIIQFRIQVGPYFDPYAYRLAAFDNNNNLISNKSVTGDSATDEYVNGTYTVPSGISKICVCSQSNEDVFVKQYDAARILDVGEDELDNNCVTNFKLKEQLGFSFVSYVAESDFIKGYVNRSGTIITSASKRTNPIIVQPGQTVFYRIKVGDGFDPYACRIAAFDSNDNFISELSIVGNATGNPTIEDVYVVPIGVAYVIVSSMDFTDGGFVKVCSGELVERILEKTETKESVYYVGSTRSFTSIIGLFELLKNDNSKKTIYIDAGEYDIWQDYLDNNIEPPYNGQTDTSNYFNCNSFVPANTKIIGLGKVVIKMQPTKQQILDYVTNLPDTTDVNARALMVSKCWCPINIGGAVQMENIVIKCKNVRYCVHDDMHNAAIDRDTFHSYNNCQFEMDVPEDISGQILGFAITVGMGWSSGSRHEYKDCVFINNNSKRSFYGHGSPTKGSYLLLDHCVCKSPSNYAESLCFQTLSGDVYSRVYIADCYIEGGIYCELYGGSHNVFEISIMNGQQIVNGIPYFATNDADNPYPLVEYRQ